jgi:hypothetical protein
LHDRLAQIERGEVSSFRAGFAEQTIRNSGRQVVPAPQVKWPWEPQPNEDQRSFVRLALTNEVAWLWGPPGTGKTDVLSALTFLLFGEGKRVLVCSNTNQAVDQLLLKLCGKLREVREPALTDGRVIRLGTIDHEQLRQEFAQYISVENVVARKSEKLLARKHEVEAELERLGREKTYIQGVLSRFAELDAKQEAGRHAREELKRREKHAQNCDRTCQGNLNRIAALERELIGLGEAGFLSRLFMRGEDAIRLELGAETSKTQSRRDEATAAASLVQEQHVVANRLLAIADETARALSGENRQEWKLKLTEAESRQQPLRTELGVLAASIEKIRDTVLREARIVGATVTRTFLRPAEFTEFDTVIIDEASMILLPAVFYAAGLARGQVVIAGDFRQLPPIVQTEQEAIHSVLGHDVFEEAGIPDAVDKGRLPSRMVRLRQQFRMDESICRIISTAFYEGDLITVSTRDRPTLDFPPPFVDRLTLVDTSRIWPFTTRNVFNSRLNLMHALAIRNLVLHLRDHERLLGSDNKGLVGICTPYAAQAKLLREMLKSHDLAPTVRASTVHGFQGDERRLMILDLVDSVGERFPGIFLQANHRDDAGGKLLNVAISRAKEALFVFANLTYLNAKLPGDAILRGMLHDLQVHGRIVDVTDVLALHPIFDDLKKFGPQLSVDPESLRTGLFGSKDFSLAVRLDFDAAEKSIVIFSGFISQERVAQMGDLLRRKIAQGVKVRCITRPPRRNGTIPEEQGRAALRALESIGCVVDLRNDIHEKVVLVEGKVAWFGSLNPLSHTNRTSELMARIEDGAVAAHLANLLALPRRARGENSVEKLTDAENPRCEDCSGWTVLVRGRFGPFFACERNCGWKQNVDRPRKRK